MVPNPFKPTAGATPPSLIGRQGVLEEFGQAFVDGPGAPGLLTRFIGPRGTGKTVMLTEVRGLAQRNGWISLAETATAGLIDRIIRLAAQAMPQLSRRAKRRRSIESINLPQVMGMGGGGVAFAQNQVDPIDLRGQLSQLLDVVEESGGGVLITVDEVHRSARDELRVLATVFQHLVTEGRSIGLVLAGLPSAVSDLLNDDVLTFLRRAVAVELGPVDLTLVGFSFEDLARQSGLKFDPDALALAVEATDGYPYMIQLVGYHVWRHVSNGRITADGVNRGLEAARSHLASSVLAATLADLTAGDRDYLAAMALDDGPSSTAQVAARLGKSATAAGQFRLRLLDAGVIHAPSRGQVDFALPNFRQYIRTKVTR